MDVLLFAFYVLLGVLGYKMILRLLEIPWISSLDSRYIMITGCDSGFGNATAIKLDSLGCHVIAACFTEKGETELKKSCSNRLQTIHLDVANPNSVQKVFQQVKAMLPAGKGQNTHNL